VLKRRRRQPPCPRVARPASFLLVVYDVALAPANGRSIPRDLYDRAVEALGDEGVTDLIVLMGYYTCVSLTMNFYSVPVSGGGTPRH
jgi:4-carboxymuconolactone decarboxylase